MKTRKTKHNTKPILNYFVYFCLEMLHNTKPISFFELLAHKIEQGENMEKLNTENRIVKNNKITITNCKSTSISGISKVNSATDNCISVVIENNNCMFEGENLYVTKLDVESGIIEFEGTVFSIKLGKQKNKKNIIKRLFD